MISRPWSGLLLAVPGGVADARAMVDERTIYAPGSDIQHWQAMWRCQVCDANRLIWVSYGPTDVGEPPFWALLTRPALCPRCGVRLSGTVVIPPPEQSSGDT